MPFATTQVHTHDKAAVSPWIYPEESSIESPLILFDGTARFCHRHVFLGMPPSLGRFRRRSAAKDS